MCGSYRRKPYAQKDGGRYVRCRSCATVYADARLTDEALMGRLCEFAPDPDISPEARRAEVAAEAWKVELVEALPLPGRRLLDVGCGTGGFVAAAAEAGFEAEGHDLAPAVAEAAAKRHGFPVHTGPLADLPGPYDVVTLWDTLEHCVSPPAVLADVAGLLAPGGWVVILSPNAAGISARLLRGRWWVFGPTDHLVMFSIPALTQALARAGLRPVALRTRQLAPPYRPEEADPARPLMRLHAVLNRHDGFQALLTRTGLGDWIFAAAGRPAPRALPA
jgi:2-polyprenyl-3-methyl-5-hydroxy-6-metoxy-1,4-benzoquinol methylase